MEIFLVILSILVLAYIIFQLTIYFKSKNSVNKPIPFENIADEFSDKIRDKKGLIYFFSPTCGNCKVQTPIIESLEEKIKDIISIDTSIHIKTAKVFNVMAIPSLVFFSGNNIKGFYFGVKNESFILNKLNSI